MDFDEIDRKQVFNLFYQVSVFLADWQTKMAAQASDMLRHFILYLCKGWYEFLETSQEANTQKHPLPRLCFLGHFIN